MEGLLAGGAKEGYYAHVSAVELGEPGVVGDGGHDDGQVPAEETHGLEPIQSQTHQH